MATGTNPFCNSAESDNRKKNSPVHAIFYDSLVVKAILIKTLKREIRREPFNMRNQPSNIQILFIL